MERKIFISYRREDNPAYAGWLHDRLAERYGRDNVFRDVDAIEPGVDFLEELNRQVAACDFFIAMIGKNWLDARDPSGRRRLDSPGDFVRIEIEAALARDIRTVPVLVESATMPLADDLPASLKPLAFRNAVSLSHERFGSDAAVLLRAIDRHFAMPAPVDGRDGGQAPHDGERLAGRTPESMPGPRTGVRLRAGEVARHSLVAAIVLSIVALLFAFYPLFNRVLTEPVGSASLPPFFQGILSSPASRGFYFAAIFVMTCPLHARLMKLMGMSFGAAYLVWGTVTFGLMFGGLTLLISLWMYAVDPFVPFW